MRIASDFDADSGLGGHPGSTTSQSATTRPGCFLSTAEATYVRDAVPMSPTVTAEFAALLRKDAQRQNRVAALTMFLRV